MSFPDEDGEKPFELTQPANGDLENDDDNDGDEAFVGFADEDSGEEVEQTPLVRQLRAQIRELSRKNAATGRTQANDDPEPIISPRPKSLADFEYDEDRFNAAMDKHLDDTKAHDQWGKRQEERKAASERAAEDRQRKVEMQRGALGVSDFDEKAAAVKDRLSDVQLGILLEGTDNAAALIYALGRSETKLDQLAAETNLTRFAVLVGKLETAVKMGKRQPPQPETRVRGGNASVREGFDSQLEKLEKEADRTGDRSKVIAYKRAQRNAA